MDSSSISSLSAKTSSLPPLYQMKLLAALQSGHHPLILPYLTEIGAQKTKSTEGGFDLAAMTLHLAVRFASCDTISFLLSNRSISPNAIHPLGSGTTALHVAASTGRADVVRLLLEQDGIDDTLRDSNGNSCQDLAEGEDVARAFGNSIARLTLSYRTLLHTYIISSPTSQPPQPLLDLLSSPRIKHVDLSYTDDASGTTLLHTAAKRKDLRLAELSVRAGADVFAPDRRGRTALDESVKHDSVRGYLKKFTKSDTMTTSSYALSSAPLSMKGFLHKYANIAKGYNQRWFVLQDGMLSYYLHQDDENIASRGSIAMKTAVLHVIPGGLEFEIHNTFNHRHQEVQKWYVKANNPGEATRWTQAISQNIDWYKQKVGERHSEDSSLSAPWMKGSITSSTIDTDTTTEESCDDQPPFDSSFGIQGNYVHVQMGLILKHLQDVLKPNVPLNKIGESANLLKECVTVFQKMLEEYLKMVVQREQWWESQLKREKKRQDSWEKNWQAVVSEGEEDLWSQGGHTPGMPKSSRYPHASHIFGSETSIASPDSTPGPPMTTELPPSGHHRFLNVSGHSLPPQYFFDTDEEIESFVTPEPTNLPIQSLKNHSLLDVNKSQYAGYMNLRKSLAITNDNRSPTSLWSVLKHSIGKDLTKISFPVSSSEPTSMLQRMAEDMEFSQCLCAASDQRDSLKRLAFVAAFAMSNYSSTIGRIAKPFNPMLGETFEYVHLEHEYRYLSEQVSHHPPISACWAESPYWTYYGEVHLQNRFVGSSFEIKPAGTAHAELLLPESWAPNYPKANNSLHPGKVIEHYSWKKVTTSVSGLVLGSPTIDHYGEMTIKNHRTGEQCVLTFKPRSVFTNDPFEVSGHINDSGGHAKYEIAGRWNTQLIARAVGTSTGHLHPDVADPHSPEHILLWRNSEKPAAPFNLTPFAMTLNDCPRDTLMPVLCPTDCRLRPDQRAFELGKYDRAAALKIKQEEKQRAMRKDREAGRIPPHKPRWFTDQTDPDTGERFWSPSRVGGGLEYWVERERVWKSKQNGGGERWGRVEDIFIQYDGAFQA